MLYELYWAFYQIIDEDFIWLVFIDCFVTYQNELIHYIMLT